MEGTDASANSESDPDSTRWRISKVIEVTDGGGMADNDGGEDERVIEAWLENYGSLYDGLGVIVKASRKGLEEIVH